MGAAREGQRLLDARGGAGEIGVEEVGASLQAREPERLVGREPRAALDDHFFEGKHRFFAQAEVCAHHRPAKGQRAHNEPAAAGREELAQATARPSGTVAEELLARRGRRREALRWRIAGEADVRDVFHGGPLPPKF